MEFILISENKIKVMLTAEDLDEFDIDTDELDYSNTDTKRMFWDILSRAKHCTGFNTDGQKVLVQLYPSRHGGCEMFVTKIGVLHHTNIDGTGESQYPPIITEKITYGGEKVNRQEKKQYATFKFESLGIMLSVCRALHNIGYSEESSAYISEDDRLYLTLLGVDTSGYEPFDKYSFLLEYGSCENHDAAERYLCEHARPICLKNAVETLARC